MANPKKLDIVLETGIDFDMSMTLYDSNNVPIDFTGSTVDAQLRQYAEAADSFPFSVSHNNTGGRVALHMGHEMTAEIPYSTGVYDVRVNFYDGSVQKPIEGDVTIVPGVTR